MTVSELSPGEVALQLLANSDWIKRRVEAVALQVDGETRRKISFDFEIPSEKLAAIDTDVLLKAPNVGDSVANANLSLQAAVPLCFMQKTTIVDLDVADQHGNTLSVATTRENGYFVLHAFKALVESFGESVIGKNDIPVLPQDWLEVIDAVIMSHWPGNQRSYVQQTEREARRVVVRAAIDNESEKVIKPNKEDERIAVLLRWAVEERRNANARKDEELETKILLFLALLEAMTVNYVFTVIAPTESIRGRALIKVSYGAKLHATQSPWKRLFLASETLELSASSRAAQSTHLEFQALHTLQIESVTKYDSEERRTQVIPATVAPNRVHLYLRGSSRPPSVKLAVQVAPQRIGIVWVAFVLSTLGVLAQLGLLLLASHFDRVIGKDRPVMERAEYLGIFRDTSALSIVTLAISVTIAAVLVNQFHDVDRKVTIGPRIIVCSAVVIFGVSLSIGSYRLTHLNTDQRLACALLGLAVLSLLVFLWSLVILYRTSSRRREKLMKDVHPIVVEDSALDESRDHQQENGIASEASLFDGLSAKDIDRIVGFYAEERGNQ